MFKIAVRTRGKATSVKQAMGWEPPLHPKRESVASSHIPSIKTCRSFALGT